MEYGCRIWDEQGSLILDTNDYTARLIYMDIKPGDAEGSIYLPDADGAKPLLLVSPAPQSVNEICLVVDLSDWGLLSWEPAWEWGWAWDPATGWDYYDHINILSEHTMITVYVCDERIW